jgi:hypothetical protein
MGFAESDPVARAMVATFTSTLSELGWTEGRNVRIELRWAESRQDLLSGPRKARLISGKGLLGANAAPQLTRY